MELIELVIIIAMAGLLSIFAQYMGLLTFDGAAASLAIGLVIGIFGSFEWLLILIIFTALGFAATVVGITKKKRKGLQEGTRGERMYKNVVAVGIVPCIFAVLSYFSGDEHHMLISVAFISSLAVAAADTVASEIGVRDKRVWMITTFKRTEPGVNGGISVTGTFMAAAASFVTVAIGWYITGLEFDMLFFVPAAAGIIGCFADSILGAAIEDKGYISKYTNNAITAMIGSVFAMVVYILCF
ncbi:MAG: DUF92 domain-containing protein [Methanomassiliicoccaceae archaeon]|nr:DUF92 domain-containing protein [Methanomassiliicoccaceae archaeon]